MFSAVAASSAVAKEFVMSYDGFYDRLKVVNKGDFQYARVNFYISDIGTNEVCSIKSGTILTEKNEYCNKNREGVAYGNGACGFDHYRGLDEAV